MIQKNFGGIMYKLMIFLSSLLFFIAGCSPAHKSFHMPELSSSDYPRFECKISDIDEPVVLKKNQYQVVIK